MSARRALWGTGGGAALREIRPALLKKSLPGECSLRRRSTALAGAFDTPRRIAAQGGATAVLVAALLLPAVTAPAAELYKAAPGPLTVNVDDSVVLPRAEGAPMPVRAVYPSGEGPWPLVVYSHGTFASNRDYMPIVEHWASHGYAVLLPDHIDAHRAVMPRSNADMENIIRSRATDISALLDQLAEVEARVAGLAGRLAGPPYVAAGHSIGTYIAMLEAGLRTRNPKTGAIMAHAEQRFGAVLMSSDPGKMALMPEGLWRGVSVPTFLATGTEDFGTQGKGRRPSEYTSELLTGADAPPGQRYELLLVGGDHYFGGLVHRKPSADAVPDVEGLHIFNALSTAFLDAYAAKQPAALEYLADVDVRAETGGRANLIRE